MKKIIFVSTNNTCRSFIAESVLRKYLKDAHRRDIQVESKGLVVLFPEPVHTKAADLVRKSGIEMNKISKRPSSHRKMWRPVI